MDLISIIVPVYNIEKYLDRCIQSILSQTYTNFELLLIDDGSTDSSGAICDSYAEQDSRVRVFHKPNGGVSSARNMGLDNANGEWITFCDSDDWVYDCWLQNYVDNSDNVDIVCQGVELDYSRMVNCFKQNEKVGFDYEGKIADGLELLHEYGLVGSMCIKLFKMDIVRINSLRLNPMFNYMEDEEFVIRYLSFCKNVKSIKKVGYYYFYLESQQLDKYVIRNQFELYQSLYTIGYSIIKEITSPTILYYINEYSSCLLCGFKRKIPYNKLMVYRKCVGRNVLHTRLFWLTKWMIYIDPTAIFSSLVIVLHNKLKQI